MLDSIGPSFDYKLHKKSAGRNKPFVASFRSLDNFVDTFLHAKLFQRGVKLLVTLDSDTFPEGRKRVFFLTLGFPANLKKNVQTSLIEQALSLVGKVTLIKLFNTSNGDYKGLGFCDFKETKDRAKAVEICRIAVEQGFEVMFFNNKREAKLKYKECIQASQEKQKGNQLPQINEIIDKKGTGATWKKQPYNNTSRSKDQYPYPNPNDYAYEQSRTSQLEYNRNTTTYTEHFQGVKKIKKSGKKIGNFKNMKTSTSLSTTNFNSRFAYFLSLANTRVEWDVIHAKIARPSEKKNWFEQQNLAHLYSPEFKIEATALGEIHLWEVSALKNAIFTSKRIPGFERNPCKN